MSNLIDTTLNDVFKSTPIGSIDNAIGNAFYGINHRQVASPIQINKDSNGLTFFTRPQLNMTTSNLRADRRFIPLLTSEEASIQRAIRCYLDPRLTANNPSFRCPFVDNQSAFIPLLTNHLTSCSGWPDIALDTFVSKPGAYKEVYSQVDSVVDLFSAYDITSNFRNIVADPITAIFFYWTLYESLVFRGILVPYPDFIVKNEYDYNTRIYRLVMDSNKRYVQKIGCCGAAYPVSVPMGTAFNFESDKPLNMGNNEISINFKFIGACYQDDIIVHEYNSVVGIFCPNMRDKYRSSAMKKIPIDFLSVFNNKGYPRIDPNSYELEWYVTNENYLRVTSSYAKHSKALSK